MQQLFDELIGTPPPTSIDSRALVRRDRRVRATRWSVLGASAVAAGIAVVAFTTATAPSGTPPVGAPPSETASPADNRLELRAATREEAQVSAGQLKAALDAAVRAAVPTATWDPKGFDITVIDYVQPMGWIGGVDVKAAGKSGTVSASLHGLPATIQADPLTCANLAKIPRKENEKLRGHSVPAAPPCVDARTPSGKQVVTFTNTTKGTESFQVEVGMADNRVMSLQIYGVGVLTLDQLLTVAEEATERIK